MSGYHEVGEKSVIVIDAVLIQKVKLKFLQVENMFTFTVTRVCHSKMSILSGKNHQGYCSDGNHILM